MDAIFNPIATPFGWLLNVLYNFVQNYAVALLLVAIVVKVILLPFQMKGKRGMMRQSRLQPKIAELQKRHGANKQKLNEEMAKLYKEEGVNPASGCLWTFIQMPIMIALFYVIRQPLTLMMGVARDLLEEGGAIYSKLQELNFESSMQDFYVQIDQAQFITAHFSEFAPLSERLHQIYFNLGIINLAVVPDWQIWNFPWDDTAKWLPMLLLFFFPVLSGGAQFISAGIMRKMSPQGSPEAGGGTMGNVIKFMPLMSVWFGFILPAALSFYWTIGTILQIGQDIWLTKKYTKILDAEDADKAVLRKARDEELEIKRLESERRKAEGLVERNTNISKKKKKKSSKQEQIVKAAEWEKKNTPAPVDDESKYEPGRVGKRKYARGRAYDPERYSNVKDDNDDETKDDEDDVITVPLSDISIDNEPYEYAEEDNEYVDDSYEDFEDDDEDDDEDDEDLEDDVDEDDEDDEDDDYEDDDVDSDEDDEDDEDDDEDDDYEDDEDDDVDGDEDDDYEDDEDDDEAESSERFETKRFD